MAKILVVDDSEHVRDYVLAHFGGWGYEADSCNSCASAVETMSAVTLNLIVLNINLPGLGDSKRLRNSAWKAKRSMCKIVAMSVNSRL